MIKKSFLTGVLFCLFISVSAQFSIGITGTNPAPEGSTLYYDISYPGFTPDKYDFQATITNGTIISQDLDPFSLRIYVRVQWNCGVSSGLIRIEDTRTGIYNTLNVTITPTVITGYCQKISPFHQRLLYGQLPSLLTVSNCTPYSELGSQGPTIPPCWQLTSNPYKWEVGNVPVGTFPQLPLSWSDAPGPGLNDNNFPLVYDATYQPHTYATNSIKAYRRRTTFIYLGVTYHVYSNIAIVSIFDVLVPGVISGGNTFSNGVPIINESPATGGLCDGYNYVYTWEISIDNVSWAILGTTQAYPSTAQIPGPCYIRRKVSCGGEELISNVLHIVPVALNPGSIIGGGTLSFNTVPNVTQSAASGGACTSVDYIYTWERSINNGQWLAFGSGVAYPANSGIIASCKIRRKVHCVFEDAYTNEVSFVMLPYNSPNVENLNYVRTNDILIPAVHTWEQADVLLTGDKLQNTTYLDGFGRPIQTVIKQGSLKQSTGSLDPSNIANYQDLVSHFEYDGLGRTVKTFLPYGSQTTVGFFKQNSKLEQKAFVNAKFGEPTNSDFTSSQVLSDNSPLNRIVNIKLPGSTWNTNLNYMGISQGYEFYNPSVENVINWEIGFNTGDIPVVASNPYSINSLIKNITKDEKGKLIYEYKDFSGNVILKKVQEKEIGAGLEINGYAGWLSTFYVYDDLGRLRYTISPEAVEYLRNPTNNWVITNDVKKGLCFYQEYDKKNRITLKHSPDGGEVWQVYDNRDRMVLLQDENQRNRANGNPAKPNQWLFSLYDNSDKLVCSGIIDDARDRNQMQSFVDGLIDQDREVEIFTGAWSNIVAYNPVAGKIPGSSNFYCQSCTESFVNKVIYYDTYSHASPVQNFTAISKNLFAPTANAFVDPHEFSMRIKGMPSVTKIRVLDELYDNTSVGDDKFLSSTTYIDEKGRVIQDHNSNIKGGVDVLAIQYDFAGHVLSTRGIHGSPSGLFDQLFIITKNNYDLLGRGTSLLKLYTKNNSDVAITGKYKKISEFTLDDYGRAKSKAVGEDPVNIGSPLEIQDFSYNIQGWLTGINKNYALVNSDPGNPMNSQWSRRFGIYFGYEGDDEKFNLTQPQWNQNLRGTIWRSQGDNALRKYSYEYDNISRLKAARFTQKENPAAASWNTNKVDLSSFVTGYSPNGNIVGFQQAGIIPGTNGGVMLDNLQYDYYNLSSKLKNVSDLASGAVSGKQGDFKDYSSSNATDFGYDFNGNLKYDKNKNLLDVSANQTDPNPQDGIKYNFLDLPQQVTLKDKSKIEYTYDAEGLKLSKKITLLIPNAPPPKTTYYIGGLTYEDDNLLYILNEEGRVRIIDAIDAWSGPSGQVNYLKNTGNVEISGTGTPSKWGVWDYFIKDNLSNTRMVLTEEYHQQQMSCSMEISPLAVKTEEEVTFGNSTNNEVVNTRFDTPSGWPANGSAKVSKLLNLGVNSIGPNNILKVMAGDEMAAKVKYYYQANGTATSNGIITSIVNSLLAAMNGSVNATQILKDNVNPGNPTSTIANINSFLSNNQPNTPNSTQPRAYLNYIFFDEQFNYVSEVSGAKQVHAITSGTSIAGELYSEVLKVPKNGYVYIYLSNETQNVNVYFDEFQVSHTRGPIVEDNAYYPFGLRIQGISAKAAIKPIARQGYQGDYNDHDDETGYHEFSLRNYDPQIGRWIQVDPKLVSPGMYNGMGNNPVNQIDPDGGGPPPPEWVSYTAQNGDLVVQWFSSAIDPQSAKTAVELVGGTNANFIGKTGTWSSNVNGIQMWVLNDNGKATNWTAILNNIPESQRIIPKPKFEEVRAYVPHDNWAGKWDNFNNLLEIYAPSTAVTASKVVYNFLDAFWTGSSMVKNGWRDTRNMRGDNLLSKYGGEGAFNYRFGATITVLSLPLGAIGAESSAARTIAADQSALDGSFSVWNWEGYPSNIPKPKGPFKLIQGEEYSAARIAADKANKAISREFQLKGKFVDIHEINPVKFGGSPTDIRNKMFIDRSIHQKLVSPFWKKIQNGIPL